MAKTFTPDVQEVSENRFACDGGGGAGGHPRVYLTLDADGIKECPYCGKQFVKRQS